MGPSRGLSVLLKPFCALSTAKVIALKATLLLLLLTLLIKAKIRITGFSALGFCLLLLQTLVFLAIGAGLVVAAGGAALYAMQQLRQAATPAGSGQSTRPIATPIPSHSRSTMRWGSPPPGSGRAVRRHGASAPATCPVSTT